MKPKFIALLLLLTVSACFPKKKRDVEPELAGTYQVSKISLGQLSQNYPDGSLSANVVVRRLNDEQIDVKVNEIDNGVTDTSDLGTLPIKKANGKDYDILNATNNTRIGTINGTDFRLDFDVNGERFMLEAKK